MNKRVKKILLIFREPDILITFITLIAATVILILEVIGGITNPLLFGVLLVLDLLATSNLITLTGRLTQIESLAVDSNALLQQALTPAVGILTGTSRSGIANVFARRMKSERAQRAIEEHIKTARKKLLIAGVAFPEFLVQGRYTSLITAKLEESDVKFRLLLMDPRSKAADERAKIEQGRLTKGNMRDAIDVIQTYMESNRNIEVRLYNFPAMLFLLINEKSLLVEPYHFGRPETLRLGDCIGGLVPLLEVEKRESPESFYSVLVSHFDYIWNKRGDTLPVYSRVVIREYNPEGKFVVLENTARDFSEVLLSGWTISTDEEASLSIPAFSLSPQSHFTLHEIELGKNKPNVLFLRNASGVVVARSEYTDNKYIPQGYYRGDGLLDKPRS